MLRKIQTVLTLTALTAAFGCGSSNDLSGDYQGVGKIYRQSYSGNDSAPLTTQNGSFALASFKSLKLGRNTPIPDCNIKFSDFEVKPGEYQLIATSRTDVYKGNSNDGQGCQTEQNGVTTDIEILGGKIKKEADQIIVQVQFMPHGSNSDSNLVYEIRGHKKSWF